MTINSVYSLSFIAMSIVITIFFVKRLGKSGCVTFGYIGLVIFCINLFTILSSLFMVSSIKNLYSVIVKGEKYVSTVVSLKQTESEDSSAMFQPTVRFFTEDGDLIEKELEFSTSDLKVGSTYEVSYDEKSGKIVTLGFTLIIGTVGAFLFFVVFTALFVGIIIFSLGFKMDQYITVISKIGWYFFIPFLMIGFDALLIYALFYGNEVPIYVTGILVFFIISLTLATIGIIKNVFTQGLPVMKRVSASRWTGGWRN